MTNKHVLNFDLIVGRVGMIRLSTKLLWSSITGRKCVRFTNVECSTMNINGVDIKEINNEKI